MGNVGKHLTESEFLSGGKDVRALFEASLMIAKCKKSYKIGKELLLAVIKMSSIVHGEKETVEMRKIPSSNNTVSRSISDMSEDQREQLILRIKESGKFSIQLNESSDITNMAYLWSHVRYIHNNNTNEQLLLCQSLHQCTTGMDIFQTVDASFIKLGLLWKDCVGMWSATDTHRRDGVVVRASTSQSVDLGFISQVESYQKTLKNGIHSFPA